MMDEFFDKAVSYKQMLRWRNAVEEHNIGATVFIDVLFGLIIVVRLTFIGLLELQLL